MDYAIAVIVYFTSIIGVFYSMYCMVVFRFDRKLVAFFTLSSVAFCFTMFVGGTMVQAIN
jgi:hypothetical protein